MLMISDVPCVIADGLMQLDPARSFYEPRYKIISKTVAAVAVSTATVLQPKRTKRIPMTSQEESDTRFAFIYRDILNLSNLLYADERAFSGIVAPEVADSSPVGHPS